MPESRRYPGSVPGIAGLPAAALVCLIGMAGPGGVRAEAGPDACGAPSACRPSATFQEIMDSVVDPAADYIWNSVTTVADETGVHEHRPRTDDEWHEFRRHAIVLAEAANLIAIPGRKVALGNRTVADGSTLDTAAIQGRLTAQRNALVGFADALRDVALKLVAAADRRDVDAVFELGGTLDEVCEACHKVFWYPDQDYPAPAVAPAAAGNQPADARGHARIR